MNEREKKIAAVTIALAALGVLYYFWYLPWSAKRVKILEARTSLRLQLQRSMTEIAAKPQVERVWKGMDAALKKQDSLDDTSLNLISTMITLTEKAGINLAVNGQTSQDVSASAAAKGATKASAKTFREVILETKFDCKWEQLVDLLAAVSESDDLLRTRRISIRSDEKNSRLDVELRVTTIERKKS